MDWAEHAARRFEPRKPDPRPNRWPTPGHLAKYLDRRTVQTPALDLIDKELVRLRDEPDGRLIISMPPQEGKSSRVARDFPVWWLTEVDPDARIIAASYGQSLANRNGLAMRRIITSHPELKLALAPDNGAAHDWSIHGHDGGVFSVGVGGGLTGRPGDLVIIDDPIKDRKEADSEVFRDRVWDWWTSVVAARLAPGAPVVVILTRWHEDDLAGRLLKQEGSEWRLLNIPAEADHNPAKGETDPLGREVGEFMDSARRRSRAGWERRKREAGPRDWQALYQGRPTPPEGGILKRGWWQWYSEPMWVEREDGSCIVPGLHRDDTELIQSWDMTFKDSDGSDFVVGQVWLRIGVRMYLLDQVRGHWSFEVTCQKLRALTAKWPQAIAKLIEDKANGPAIINALRQLVGGMIPIEPEGSKLARASAVSPFVQARNVYLPDPELVGPWVEGFVDEAAGFPNATHDDQVDAFSQAATRLLLEPLLDPTGRDAEDLLDDDDDLDDTFNLM